MERSRLIKILQHELIIDETDFEFVTTLSLSVVIRDRLKHVAINTKPYYKQYLHRVLLNVTDSNKIVDHINGNGLDNRRCNLRVTNKVGNALNMQVNRNKKSGLPKGVYKEREGYKAQIQINRCSWYLGHFSTIEQAEAAYLKELAKYWETQPK